MAITRIIVDDDDLKKGFFRYETNRQEGAVKKLLRGFYPFGIQEIPASEATPGMRCFTIWKAALPLFPYILAKRQGWNHWHMRRKLTIEAKARRAKEEMERLRPKLGADII